ncbi:MAG TPA: efflux RND transporter periplasmic adaptor subunit [Burkholderiales bacterium]|nr:efflux RND transporter periplasmic adaptor subunit [Burkholderiales bacterium]
MRFLVLLVALAPLLPVAQAEPAVASKPLAQVALYPQREASAQAVALNESRIAAEIAARIVQIPVEVGQTVARGAVVARLDCRDQELARERAKAALAAARSRLALSAQQLARARELVARGFISKDALDARNSEVEVLRADAAQSRVQLATAERAVGKCTLRAPFAAIVRQRLGQVGELAAPGTPLVALADAGRIEVAAQLQPRDAASLRAAREIRFLGDGGARPLKLLRVSPAIDPQARTVEARLAFATEAAAPGAAGRIVWRDSAPHLPPEMVVRRNGTLGVFLDAAGVARFHPLPEAQEGRPAPVELPADASVVVQGQLTLQDGQRLR